MVFVAIRPNAPSFRNRSNARRKKWATRSALPCDSSWIVLSQSRYPSACPPMHRVLPRERWIAHERIEPRILAVEHLGKLNLPVKRTDRLFSVEREPSGPLRAAGGVPACAGSRDRPRADSASSSSSVLALPIVVAGEEGRRPPGRRRTGAGPAPRRPGELLAEQRSGASSRASRICAALVQGRRELLLDGRAREVSLLLGLPVERRRSASGESPTSESPHRRAWSRNVNGWSFASVASQSESLARSTAIGFLSTP